MLRATSLSGATADLAAADIDELTTALAGDLLTRDAPEYNDARRVWNGQIDRRPALIARCRNEADVIRMVRFAAHHRLLTSVRGGGHNVGGTALCDGGLVIDLSPIKSIDMDVSQRRVRVGAGVTWAELDATTQQQGLAVPGGVVSTTGVSGLTLSGGIGWLRRWCGLSCDNLTAATLVTAEGDILRVDAEHQADLFWALRGGGGNFGVVTELEYRLHPVGPEVYFVAPFYPAEQAGSVLRRYRDFTETAPETVSSFAICGTVPAEPDYPEAAHGRPYVLLAALYAGDVESGREVLAPLTDLGSKLADFTGVMPYVEVQQLLDGDYPEGRQYYWKSLYMDRLDDAAIDRLAALARERPSELSTVDIWHLGGAIDRSVGGPTAFENRHSPYLLGVESNWDDRDASGANIDWTRRVCEQMRPYATNRGYLNFEPADSGVAERAYPEHYRRLRELKRRWDPTNLFRVNHNIPPG